MKKFLLVIFIGMVLAINIFGIVEEFKKDITEGINYIEKSTIAVYME